MFQVIHGGNETKLTWHYVGLPIIRFIGLNAFGVFEFFKDVLDGVREPLLDGLVVVAFQTIIIGIFQDSSEHKRPRYPLDTVSRVVDFSSRDLCIDVVLQLLLKR